MRDAKVKDRRVQKTRRLILQALGSLLHEKRYEAIVVREILDRANVGRSTFYAHFRDKDELLVSAIRDVLGAPGARRPSSARRSERVIQFSGPLFHHVGQVFRGAKGGVALRSHGLVHERLRRVLVERVSEDLASGPPGRVPHDLLTQHVTSTFVLVLNWWVESGGRRTPAEVDEVFRTLVLPGLAAALD